MRGTLVTQPLLTSQLPTPPRQVVIEVEVVEGVPLNGFGLDRLSVPGGGGCCPPASAPRRRGLILG